MAPPRTRLRLRTRLGLCAGASVFALLAAEGIYRCLEPSGTPRGLIRAADGTELPLGEIISVTTRLQGAAGTVNAHLTPPYGLQPAHLKLRMGFTDPKPRWHYFDADGCVPMETNSLGLRDEEFPVAKRPGELRILALGDSMTYGQGVRLDLCWVQVLEARLRAEREPPVEVLNAGFATGPGTHSPAGYEPWLAQHGVLFDPDLVLVGVCLNDVGPIPMLPYRPAQRQPVLGGFSHLLDAAVLQYRLRQARRVTKDYMPDIVREPQAWQGTQAGLLAMRDLLRRHGIPFAVAVFPMMAQLEPELYPLRPVHSMVVDFCRESDIRCVDLLPPFLGLDEAALWVHGSDQHPNHEGHRILAEALHAWLAREGLLVPRRG